MFSYKKRISHLGYKNTFSVLGQVSTKNTMTEMGTTNKLENSDCAVLGRTTVRIEITGT